MNPKIVTIQEKQVIGMKSQMLMHQYGNIVSLWKKFMPRKNEIPHLSNTELIALQDYTDFGNFEKPFDILACAEVSTLESIPEDMLSYTIPNGLYAIFPHKGMNAGATYQRIMSEWLPNSGYAIDDRPHFQVMGAKYKNGSEDSEEDFYVPVLKHQKNNSIEMLSLGNLILCLENKEYSYRGKINFLNMEYKTEIVLPTDNKKVSVYQLTYFKEIYKNLREILEMATRMPNSKIDILKCRIDSVLIPDKENNSYSIDAEIVVTQKEKKIFGRSIYSIILNKLEVIDIIST